MSKMRGSGNPVTKTTVGTPAAPSPLNCNIPYKLAIFLLTNAGDMSQLVDRLVRLVCPDLVQLVNVSGGQELVNLASNPLADTLQPSRILARLDPSTEQHQEKSNKRLVIPGTVPVLKENFNKYVKQKN